MIYAYDKIYLDKARTALGRMLDFAVYELGYDLTEFFGFFLQTRLAEQFGDGDIRLLVGMSGVELAYEVLEKSKIPYERIKPKYPVGRSPEYWTGWALAYYQWETAKSFRQITESIPLVEIYDLYPAYHEMDIRQFVDKMDVLYIRKKPETNLKRLRMYAGLSQRDLSGWSGVPLRTIQQYEQRQKNINQAQAEYLVALSQVLCCTVMDLMETVAPADKTWYTE